MSYNNEAILLFASAVVIFKWEAGGTSCQSGSIPGRRDEEGQKQACFRRQVNSFKNAICSEMYS